MCPKRVFWRWRWRSELSYTVRFCCTSNEKKKKKKKKSTCGLVCVTLQFLISVTSPASNQCCIEWPYTCHQFEQGSPLSRSLWLLTSRLLVRGAAHAWVKAPDKCSMLPFANTRHSIVSFIRRLCWINLKTEGDLEYMYICKYRDDGCIGCFCSFSHFLHLVRV